MRQVPSYLIIGSGRMATHFCHYLTLLGLPFEQWARCSHSSEDLFHKASTASHILFLIKDDAISSVAQSLNQHTDQFFIHFSGQLVLEDVYGAHPLMTFTRDLYALPLYSSIPFILEKGSPPFAALLPGLPNASHSIDKTLKSFYHALCVLSGNFSCLLWQKFFQELEKTFQLPAQIALPYLQQSCANLAQNPHMALTGPLVRNDQKTIAANLDALQEDPFLSVYQSFYNIFQSNS